MFEATYGGRHEGSLPKQRHLKTLIYSTVQTAITMSKSLKWTLIPRLC